VNLSSAHQFRINKEGGYWHIGELWIKTLNITRARTRWSRAPFYSPNAPVNEGRDSIFYLMDNDIEVEFFYKEDFPDHHSWLLLLSVKNTCIELPL